MLLLILLAVAFPEMAPQALKGILWSGAGTLMIMLPPEVRLPRAWFLLGGGFVVCSAFGFLPREWFHVSPWRLDLEALGLDTDRRSYVQPELAAENWAGFAVTAFVGLFLLGHRVDSLLQHRLALGFVIGTATWTAAAVILHIPGGLFGFFPNRNHTATLLAMSTLVSLGCFTQALRLRQAGKIVLSLVPLGLFLWAVFTISESRAGVVLVIGGVGAWIFLAGFGQLRGNVGKALVLILIAASGIFLIVDSKVKTRLNKTLQHISPSSASADGSRIDFNENPTTGPDSDMDGRIAIFRDTWSMIRHENWTGVGPGQFAMVFPQYRYLTTAANQSRCLHPESDWLMMLAETGWPAAMCLVAGVAAAFSTAIYQAWHGRARLLRMGCLVAALVLCLHGTFDVPGHRIGFAWSAVFLLAISLRPSAGQILQNRPDPLRSSQLSRFAWRGVGLILVLAGGGLLHAQWTNKPRLPSTKVLHLMQETKKLYDIDQAAYDLAKSEGLDYQPQTGEDPLEVALERTNRAINTSPLDPHPHFIRGALALHFDDKFQIAAHEFAIQRRLVPTWVNLPLDQARVWMNQDPRETLTLWTEAMRRATAEEARFPKSPVNTTSTYQKVIQAAGEDETLAAAALHLARSNPALLALWARSAPPGLLDREMSCLLPSIADPDDRKSLFQNWQAKGSKELADSFAKSHLDLGLVPR